MYKILKVNINSGLIVDIIRGFTSFKSANDEAIRLKREDDLHFYHARSEID